MLMAALVNASKFGRDNQIIISSGRDSFYIYAKDRIVRYRRQSCSTSHCANSRYRRQSSTALRIVRYRLQSSTTSRYVRYRRHSNTTYQYVRYRRQSTTTSRCVVYRRLRSTKLRCVPYRSLIISIASKRQGIGQKCSPLI